MISKYNWNFKNIYPSITKWEEDFKLIDVYVQKIVALKNKLKEKANFLSYLDLNENLEQLTQKLGFYLHQSDLNLTNYLFLDLIAKLERKMQEISVQLNFVEFEIREIKLQPILLWLHQEQKYQRYIFNFQEFFRLQEHELSQKKQELLLQVALSRNSVFNLYNSLAFADHKYEKINYQNQNKILDLSLYQEILQNSDPIKDQILRIKAGFKFNHNLITNKNTFAKIYQNILTYDLEQIKLKKFDYVLDYFLIDDNINKELYLHLIRISKKYKHLFQEFVSLIKKDLKVSKIYRSDLNLNNYAQKERIDIEQAITIIKKALKPLGKKYLKNLKLGYQKNQVDYFANAKKRSGAYSSCIYNYQPIILLNYDYTWQSVNTLAHELGHSVHSLFSNQNQPFNLANYPIILAEIASTLNETLLFDYLFANAATREQKIHILKNRINDIFNTFFRQVQFADFELKAHQLLKNKKNINCQILANLFKSTCEEHGYDVFDQYPEEFQDLKYSWVRISHFFHSPFYVYKYAFAISASFFFYQQIKAKNIDSYLNFLKSGNKSQPLEILKEANIDVNKESFYLPLINNLKSLINLLKNLLENN